MAPLVHLVQLVLLAHQDIAACLANQAFRDQVALAVLAVFLATQALLD